MIPVIKQEATKSGMGAGDKVTIDLTAAGVHHALFLDFRKAAAATMTEAEIEADVGKILIKVDGEPKIEMLASEAIDLWRYYHGKAGAHTIASIVPIDFIRRNFGRLVDRQLFGYGMADVRSFTCEIDITGVVTLSSITPRSYIEPDNTRKLGRHLCIRKLTDYFSSTGVQQIDKKLPFGQADIGMFAVHFHQGAGAGVFTDVTIKASAGQGVDSDIYPEMLKALHDLLNYNNGRSIQTGWYHVDFALTNDPTGYLPLGPLTNLRADINWATNAPLSFAILCEEVRGLKAEVV
jgi:hypothetical protein